jgi:uncharacterized ferritin-like protein (DUF455 family)
MNERDPSSAGGPGDDVTPVARETLRSYALSLLHEGSLAAKLRAPPADWVDDARGAPLFVRAPVRDSAIAFSNDVDKLPKMSALTDPGARAICLHRFAHHELMAVELFAWALLAYPDAPEGLRRGFLAALVEEQAHLQLYLDRLQAHGVAFGDLPLSDYFWQHVPALVDSAHGPLAFLSMMGLTLEQANLDFTLLFRDGFRTAGDEESAGVMQRVHDDEVGHVKLAVTWAQKLAGRSDVDAYTASVPFPLSAARAKGRRFDVPARKRAGLSPAFIEHVRGARPYG